MKRHLVSLALALAASTVLGQGDPRGPVILPLDRGGEGEPGPDPTGVYSGTVTVSQEGPAVLTQTWRIALKAQPCSSCPAGQYVVSETDYAMVRFPTGIERGSVWGVINRDGSMSMELRGVNCGYLSLGLGGQSFYQSGALGPSPGSALRLVDGTIAGRISGYDCFGRKVRADIVLHKEPSSQPSSCLYLADLYSGEFDICGPIVHADTIPAQSGCALMFYSPAAKAAFSVVLTGPTEGTLTFNFTDGCTGTGTGKVTVSGGVLSGTYEGTSAGGSDCCLQGPVSGTFTLTPH